MNNGPSFCWGVYNVYIYVGTHVDGGILETSSVLSALSPETEFSTEDIYFFQLNYQVCKWLESNWVMGYKHRYLHPGEEMREDRRGCQFAAGIHLFLLLYCSCLKDNGPQRHRHYQEVWTSWKKCLTVETGFEVSLMLKSHLVRQTTFCCLESRCKNS